MQVQEVSQEVSPKVREFIDLLHRRGLSPTENIRLMNLLQRFQPYPGRRPLQEGDLILYRLFGLSEIFRVANATDAKAIETELARVKRVDGVHLPEDKVFAEDRIAFMPHPEELEKDQKCDIEARYEGISEAEMSNLHVILLDLVEQLDASPKDQVGYMDPHQRRRGFWQLLSINSERMKDEPRVVQDELTTFHNELRRLLVDALVHTIVHGRQQPEAV